MNILIFAGGAGTRLWPLSRRNSPKQFAVLKDDASTLQMAVERVTPFGKENIYISTNKDYVDLVREQVDVPDDQIMSEPARRDLAAAVGLTLLRMKQRGVSGTVAVIWSDHFMEHPDRFRNALAQGEKIVNADPSKIVFLGEHPRFPNHNLGWIHLGNHIKDNQYTFTGWKYRPMLALCEKMYATGQWMWNPGYFVFDVDTMLSWYQQHTPGMYKALVDMVGDEEKVQQCYPSLESTSLDNAILEKLDTSDAVVLKVNLGWSDPGTLYALKEAMAQSKDDNYERGHVMTHESKDCFVHNEEEGKLVATVGLEGVVVVNTKDALLVCDKDRVPEVKTLLKKLEEHGKHDYL